MPQRIISLMGGLGNQLFQLACAEWLRSRHGCTVSVDVSQLGLQRSKSSLRSLEVDPRDFGFHISRVPKSLWRVPRRIRGSICQDVGNPWELPRVDENRSFEIVRGYFQSASLLGQVKQEFVPKLERLLDQRSEAEFVAVHVRLGDYTRPETARVHGVTSPEWLMRRAHEISADVGLSRVLVFSDSLELVKQVCPPHLLRGVEFCASQRPLDVLSSMSMASAFVMSNSSLSWWGAYLAQVRDPEVQVLFPVPWLAAPSEMELRLPMPTWNTVTREILETPLPRIY